MGPLTQRVICCCGLITTGDQAWWFDRWHTNPPHSGSANSCFAPSAAIPPNPQSLTLAFSWCVLLCIGGFLSVWFNHSFKCWMIYVCRPDKVWRFVQQGLFMSVLIQVLVLRWCTKMQRLVLVKHYVLAASLVLAAFCFCFCEICILLIQCFSWHLSSEQPCREVVIGCARGFLHRVSANCDNFISDNFLLHICLLWCRS